MTYFKSEGRTGQNSHFRKNIKMHLRGEIGGQGQNKTQKYF